MLTSTGLCRSRDASLMRRSKRVWGWLFAAAMLAVSVVASAHVPMTQTSTGVRYFWDLSAYPNGAVPYFVNPTLPAGATAIEPPGTSAKDLVALTRAAFQMWQDVPTSTIRFTFKGTTTLTNGFDGINVVTFAPVGTLSSDGQNFFTVALQAGPVSIPGGGTIIAKAAGQILDDDIVISPNPSFPFSIAEGVTPAGFIALDGLLMHETGHFAGLDHSGVANAVMYGFTNLGRGHINKAPKEDDILGISVLYPTPDFVAGTGEINGNVFDAKSAPVFGANVVALDASGRIAATTLSGVATTASDGTPTGWGKQSGKYVLKGLRPGSYTLIAEPLDGPGPIRLSGVFGNGTGGVTTIDSSFLPTAALGPLSVTARNSVSFDIHVTAKTASAPNFGILVWAAPTGQLYTSPAEVEPGVPATVQVGNNENIITNNAVNPNTTFAVSGEGITTGNARVNPVAGFPTNVLIPVTVAADAVTGPRMLSVTTPSGMSVMSAGVIVIPPVTNFAQFANGQGNVSTTVVVNPSSVSAATGRLVLRDDPGGSAKTGFLLSTRDSASTGDQAPVQKTSFDFIVAPLGSATIQTDGLGPLVSGSATLRATQPVGGITKFAIQDLGVAGVDRSAPVSGFITPVRRTASINTGVAVSNATETDFNISLSLRNSVGTAVSSDVVRLLPANGHLAAFITELFPNANLTNFDGTLVVTSGNASRLITGTALELGNNVGEFTTLPVTELKDQPGQNILRFAHFANGDGIRSDVVVTNASSTATLTGRVEFFDDSGNPFTSSFTGAGSVNRIDFSIQPLGSKTFASDGLGALGVGWARVTTDRAGGGVIRFLLPGLGISGVGRSEALGQGFIVPTKSNTAQGLDTGVALVNAGDAPVTVQMTLRSSAGVTVSGGIAAAMTLPPRGHLARFAKQLFPSAVLDDFEGTLSVVVQTPGGQVSGTALEIGSSPGQFTTLPVVPLM